MYCSHFELHRPPFNNTPDPTFYFGTPEHEEALATLQYATFQRKGFVLVTGEVGAGKTLVGRMFLRQVDRSASVAAITHTNLTGHQLLAAICAEFELEVSPDATNLQLTERLQNFLLEQFARDRYAVVLVDEAQNLPDEAFEELRMLGNLEADDAKLLQVCILGQPELRERFRQPGLRQIDQRLFRRFHLPALNRVNTEAYIRHRLKVAGCIRSDLFAPEAIERLFSASQGVPRLINKICDNALLTAYGANAARVTAEMVEQSIEPELLPEPTAANETTADVVQPEAPKADPAVVPAAPADAPSAAPGEATPKPSAAQPRVAPRVPARVSQPQLRMLTSRLAETWKSVRQRMDQCRQDLQGELDEAIGQYQSLRSQFREMAPRVASQEEVGELRRLHQSYSDKIVADIARQGQEFRNLMQEAEQRWKDALAHVQVARLDGGSQEGLDILQQEFDEKAYELLARLDCHRQHISQLAEVLQGHCEQTRGELQAIRDAQAEAEGRLAAETARRVEEAREALTARMAGHEERITALNGQQQQITQVADQLKSELTGNRSELQTVRSEQAEAIERLAAETARRVEEAREALTARMAGHEEQIAALDRAVGERITSVSETLAGLERRASTRQDIEEVRRQQAAAVGEVLKLIGRQSDELVVFRGEVAVQAERRSGEQKALYEEIRSRISAQAEHLAQLQARLVEETKLVQARFAELSERFAERAEVEALDAKQAARIAALRRDGESYAAEISHLRESHEALEGRQAAQVTELRQNREMDAAEIARLRESHEAHATEVLGRIDANRDTLKKLFGTVLKRFRATQERLATLASSTVGKDELADLRARQERESQALLEQFEGQKLAMEARFDRIVWRLQETKNQLDTLSADTAKAADFEQFRCQAAEDREKVLALLSVQRRDMESMAEATQARCEALSARLDALPADIATAGQVEQVRHEHAEQIREVLGQLDQSIRQVSEYCDRTSTAVAALAAEAATSSEVGELRDEHTRKIDEIQGRMNQQEESQLNRLHLLARRVKEHARRMGQLEEQAGTPVRLELAPTAGAKLGHIVEAAHQQHSCLTEAVERAGTIASYLHEASSRVQATLTQWADNADRVDEQSRHLRTAAETSARILIAMKKCHSALDRKLNSSRWQQELARGEAVSQRLDKSTAEAQAAVKQLNAVLRDFDRIQETADDWSARTKRTQNTVEEMTRQARQTVQQLSRLLAEASSTNSKFDQSLNRRKQMLNAVAQNTTRLMELIETAHQVDEGTGKAASRKTDSRKIDRSPRVSGIDWPNLRVRSTAHVG